MFVLIMGRLWNGNCKIKINWGQVYYVVIYYEGDVIGYLVFGFWGNCLFENYFVFKEIK